MGVGGDMFRGVFLMAWIGFTVIVLAGAGLAGFLLWLLYRGVMSLVAG